MATSKKVGSKLVQGIENNAIGNNNVVIMQKNGIMRLPPLKPNKRKKKII